MKIFFFMMQFLISFLFLLQYCLAAPSQSAQNTLNTFTQTPIQISEVIKILKEGFDEKVGENHDVIVRVFEKVPWTIPMLKDFPQMGFNLYLTDKNSDEVTIYEERHQSNGASLYVRCHNPGLMELYGMSLNEPMAAKTEEHYKMIEVKIEEFSKNLDFSQELHTGKCMPQLFIRYMVWPKQYSHQHLSSVFIRNARYLLNRLTRDPKALLTLTAASGSQNGKHFKGASFWQYHGFQILFPQEFYTLLNRFKEYLKYRCEEHSYLWFLIYQQYMQIHNIVQLDQFQVPVGLDECHGDLGHQFLTLNRVHWQGFMPNVFY